MTDAHDRLKLYGFNNLTKTLSFNIYDVCYAKTRKHQQEYIAYIDGAYSGERLTQILTNVSEIIGARILNTATQSYEPQGASVTMMISEDAVDEAALAPMPNAVVSHLDKSHLTVHTYPESHPDNGVTTFRADIDVATCGRVSPLNALNYLIDSFDEDIVIMDYRVRGFTRDVKGDKHFIDNKVNSIQEFLSPETTERYQTIDMNVYHENIFHTKMMLREFVLDNYLFGRGEIEFEADELERIERQLKWEMAEIFYGRNL